MAHEVGSGVLMNIDEAHEDLAATATVVQGLHRTGQHGDPMTAVIAGLPGTAAGVARVVTYAERLRVTEVGLLNADGVAEALQGPFADHDVAIDDDVVDTVARQIAVTPTSCRSGAPNSGTLPPTPPRRHRCPYDRGG